MHFFDILLNALSNLHDGKGLDSTGDFLAVGDGVLGEALEDCNGELLNAHELIEQLLISLEPLLQLLSKRLLIARVEPHFVHLHLV